MVVVVVVVVVVDVPVVAVGGGFMAVVESMFSYRSVIVKPVDSAELHVVKRSS